MGLRREGRHGREHGWGRGSMVGLQARAWLPRHGPSEGMGVAGRGGDAAAGVGAWPVGAVARPPARGLAGRGNGTTAGARADLGCWLCMQGRAVRALTGGVLLLAGLKCLRVWALGRKFC